MVILHKINLKTACTLNALSFFQMGVIFVTRCIEVNMIKILQASVVTQTMFGGLIIHPPVANCL